LRNDLKTANQTQNDIKNLQSNDDEEPASGSYEPPGQAIQLVVPAFGWNRPDAQLVQTDADAEE